jgi:hypothetical protein
LTDVEVLNTKRNLLKAIESLRIHQFSSTAAYTTTGNTRHTTCTLIEANTLIIGPGEGRSFEIEFETGNNIY